MKRGARAQDEEEFLGYMASKGLSAGPFLATFTSGGGLRWEMACSLMNYFLRTGRAYVVFVTDSTTLGKCQALGVNCYYPRHTLPTFDLTSPGATPIHYPACPKRRCDISLLRTRRR